MMNNKEMALLGLLAENPKHGYQLEADIEARGMREWTEIGFSSIYYLLNKIEKAGWIISAAENSAEGPSRRVYRPTESGLNALHSAITQRLENPKPNSGDFQLALAFLPILTPEETNRAVSRNKTRLEQSLARVQSRLEAQSPLPPHVVTLFEYSLHRMQAELAWLNDYLDHRKKNDHG
jgi:DNA-binding PadR family transcriptional regulator